MMQPNYIPPTLEPIHERGDDLDWENLPQEPSDLNFRPEFTNLAQTQRQVLGLLFLASFLTIPFGMFFRVLLGSHFLTPVFFASAFLVACCRGLGRTSALGNHTPEALRDFLFGFALPVQVWAMIALAPLTYAMGWALGYLTILALPLVFQVIDQFASHTVHWFTANPAVALGAMNLWRKGWGRRFDVLLATPPNLGDADGARDAIRFYWNGWKKIAGCFTLGLIVVIFQTARGLPLFQVGFWFFVTLCTAMLMACLITRQRTSFGPWWQFFIAWFGHGNDKRFPNWVVQSPSGNPLQRQHALILAIWFLALGCCFVTDHFSWLLTCDPALHDLLHLGTSSTGARKFDFSYFQRGQELAVFYFLLAVIVCTMAPVLFLILLAYLATSSLVFHLQQTLTFSGEPHER